MTDNTNDIIHNITIEYLINKQYHNCFKKDGDLLISINKRDNKFYKKRILNVTRDLFLNDDVKKVLKKNGFLTRDDRKKERKKPGLRGARRAPQWAKR